MVLPSCVYSYNITAGDIGGEMHTQTMRACMWPHAYSHILLSSCLSHKTSPRPHTVHTTHTAYKISDFLYVQCTCTCISLGGLLLFSNIILVWLLTGSERFSKNEESTGLRDITNTSAGRHANHLATQHPSENFFSSLFYHNNHFA
jgi:hypothetical protein